MAIDLSTIQNLRAMLQNAGNPLRGNFYMAVAREYSATSEIGRASAHQVLIQAQITTYSGEYGAAALLGNYAARVAAGPGLYNITLDYFSYAIATRMLDAIEVNVRAGGNGI